MTRITKIITLTDVTSFSEKLLQWAQKTDIFSWLDSNDYNQKYTTFNKVLAIGVVSDLKTDVVGAFAKLQNFQKKKKDFLFGYLSYDLKNDTEDLVSKNKDGLAFPDLYFFQPKKIFIIKEEKLELLYDSSCSDEIETDLKQIERVITTERRNPKLLKIAPRISKEDYLIKIDRIKKHIQRGDTYETNFCMEYYSNNSTIDALNTYNKLNELSKPPFACFLKINNHYLLSASPERFIRKEGVKLISQPIKGTIRRGFDKKEDQKLITQLKNDPKEQSENIMIVDLVRNDLSKTATKNSVIVEELSKVYTFKQVHQMISTIVSKVDKNQNPVAIIKSLFPMGSMTGAPKISTMKIIEKLEETKRGLYSGAVGYFTPQGDFDFNVVIRSILYNSQKEYVSYSVGGAITSKSDPEKEYQECLLKARAMKEVLTK
jgi:para-aminobenzoate synthetase component 1